MSPVGSDPGPDGEPPCPAPPVARRRVLELDGHRCEELLRTASVGRIAFTTTAGPHIYPVSLHYDDHAVVFRTSSTTLLARLAVPQSVAVLVDDLDPELRSGWTVLLRGRSHAIREPAELIRLWAEDSLQPWVAGVRTLFIAVSAEHLSGRLLIQDPGPGPGSGERPVGPRSPRR